MLRRLWDWGVAEEGAATENRSSLHHTQPHTPQYDAHATAWKALCELLAEPSVGEQRVIAAQKLFAMYRGETLHVIEYFIPQLCAHAYSNPDVKLLLIRMCTESAYVALQVWSTVNAAAPVFKEESANFLRDIERAASSSRESGGQFELQRALLTELRDLSERLAKLDPALRKEELKKGLNALNASRLATGDCWLPLGTSREARQLMKRLADEESRPFNTYSRCPFIVPVEVLNAHDRKSEPERNLKNSILMSISNVNNAALLVSRVGGDVAPICAMKSQFSTRPNKANTDAAAAGVSPGGVERTLSDTSETEEFVQIEPDDGFFAVSSSALVEKRVRSKSAWAGDKDWSLVSVLVKSGDDLRQEQFCMQLIIQMQMIFADARLPLILCPYRILPFTSDAGLMETITDAVTLHELKTSLSGGTQGANYTSLLECFRAQYGEEQSDSFLRARNNFINSMAAYSIVCYLLQLKDRHNSNIMLHKMGYIIHIDFGFCLGTRVPVPIETAPFKLTAELIDVMGGPSSAGYTRFCEHTVQGFLAIRRSADMFVGLIEVSEGARLSCIKSGGILGSSTASEVRRRLRLDLDDATAAKHVFTLIARARQSWTTAVHETFQKVFSGIEGV